MSKVTMPEPSAEITSMNNVTVFDLTAHGKRSGLSVGEKFITTTQAEAYADARVREALEDAAKICWEMQSAPEFGKDDKDHWLSIAEHRIRALIPPTKNEAEE